MASDGRRPPHILIAGGGIGGLTAALALLRRGFDVDVYEQAPELREVGAGVQISANGSRALNALGVGEDVARLSCEAAGKEIRLWSTGQTWKLFDLGAESVARYGFPYFTVYRPDLLAALADGVRREKPDAIHLGAKVAAFAQEGERVTLKLEDGRTATGDALVGADGIHSRIRHGLFGAEAAKFTGMIAWRGVIPLERLPTHLARPVGTNWVGPGRHVIHYPLRHGELMNFVGIVERTDWQVESWTARGTTEELAADFAGWHADVQAMIQAIETPYKWALMLRQPLERWTVGRTTLLGDACHPTLPMMAQGAVQAIEDGFVLARALGEQGGTIEAALARYEAARRERTTRMVLASAENAKRFHNPELADPAGAQAYIDSEWAEERVRERYDWLFQYRVDEVPV
jgi:salicylate hydroxylase